MSHLLPRAFEHLQRLFAKTARFRRGVTHCQKVRLKGSAGSDCSSLRADYASKSRNLAMMRAGPSEYLPNKKVSFTELNGRYVLYPVRIWYNILACSIIVQQSATIVTKFEADSTDIISELLARRRRVGCVRQRVRQGTIRHLRALPCST
jgi:hypothetical protein